MDRRMPVSDGISAARHIKAAPGGEETIIIAMTASVFEENRAITLGEGFDDVVYKPLRIAEIVAALERHLGLRFIYSEPAGDRPNLLWPTRIALDLAALPAGWTVDLEKAVTRGDLSRIEELIIGIQDRQPTAAQAMAAALDRFDYRAILDAIKR
jgi:DNA-binding response OmpR family regulator